MNAATLRKFVCSVLFLAPTAVPQAQVVAGPEGPVEFLGLANWEARALFDTIQALAPNRPFHACAVVMKRQLGFPDAAAMGFFTDTPDEVHIVVVGIEDSSGIQYRTPGTTTIAASSGLAGLIELAQSNIRRTIGAVRSLPLRDEVPDSARKVAIGWGSISNHLQSDWAILAAANRPGTLAEVSRILREDSSGARRGGAVAALAHFPGSDSAWHLLADSFRDPDARTSTVADIVAQALLDSELTPIDWAPAESSLRALFGGTNPFAFRTALRVLTATRIDPTLGRRIASAQPDLLLAFAGATQPDVRSAALGFLQWISRTEPGTVRDWKIWLDRESTRD